MKRVLGATVFLFAGLVSISSAVAETNSSNQVEPGLPETPQALFADPCADAKAEDIRTQQTGKGLSGVAYDGSRATHDGSTDVYYQQHGASTYVCQMNSHVDKSLGTDEVDLFYDFGWGRTSHWGQGNGYTLRDRVNAGDYVTDQQGKANTSACYICGLVRHRKGCFPPGVRIATDDKGASKLVEDIGVGDLLWNPILKKQQSVARVIQGPEELPLIEISFAGSSVKVSQEHPVLTSDGLKMANELSVDDSIFGSDGKAQVISKISKLPVRDGQTVINFILEADPKLGQDGRMVLADGMITGDLILQNSLVTAAGGTAK